MPIKGFQLTGTAITPLDFDARTLDEWTGKLPQGFYSTFTTLAGGTRVLGLRSHLDRLFEPASKLGIRPAVDERTLRKRIAELAETNLPHESRLRVLLTKKDGYVYVGMQPFEPLPQTVYTQGVHVITSNIERRDPRIKDTGFIAESAAQRKLINKDVFEVLLTRNGKILEGMTSNFYVVKHVAARRNAFKGSAMLVTAQQGILLGVTRRVVLRLARLQGMSVEYRAPGVNENFDEAIITSSSRGIVPVVMMDDNPVGEGGVGAWTKTLRTAYQAYVEGRSERIIPQK